MSQVIHRQVKEALLCFASLETELRFMDGEIEKSLYRAPVDAIHRILMYAKLNH